MRASEIVFLWVRFLRRGHLVAMPDTFEIVPDDSQTYDVEYLIAKQHALARRLLLLLRLVVELGASWPPECQPWLDLITRCRR